MKSLSLFITGFLSFSGTVLATPESPIQAQLPEEHSLEFLPLHQGPVVQKFGGNFYSEQYWSASVYHDYLNAFWTGYNMQSYNYATTCLTNFNLFMDVFYTWNQTAITQKSLTELWDLFFLTAGTSANDTWYNCYLYYYDFEGTYATKWENFNDFGDIYLSFIFNMLQNSLNIKSSTENMITAYEKHDTTAFSQSLGSVLRAILDFDSYTSVAGSLGSDEVPTHHEFMGQTKLAKTTQLTKKQRFDKMEEELAPARERLADLARENERLNGKNMQKGKGVKLLKAVQRSSQINKDKPQVDLADGYEWATKDYVQAPLAFIIGSLNALPDDTSGPYCSGNATSLRTNILEGFSTSAEQKPLDAALAYHTGGAFLDEVGVLCQTSITSTLSAEHFTTFFSGAQPVAENLLYNGGYMWVDAINYVYYTPKTVPQNDWAFFTSYLAGDFIIRIFYKDATPQQVTA